MATQMVVFRNERDVELYEFLGYYEVEDLKQLLAEATAEEQATHDPLSDVQEAIADILAEKLQAYVEDELGIGIDDGCEHDELKVRFACMALSDVDFNNVAKAIVKYGIYDDNVVAA